jgi:hypothetical protein
VTFADDRKRAVKNVWGCALTLLMLLLVVALLLPAVSSAREAGRRSQCSINLRHLGLALHNYYDDHGYLPPPYVAGPDGKPMHSWRVLILPYLEETSLYNAYNFDEPWNGPNNGKLAKRMPLVFRCPSDPHMLSGMTSYFCITGPGRAKEGKPTLDFGDITDGLSNTLALAESHTARVNWLEPRDLTVEDILAGDNTAQAPCPCSYHGRQDRGVWRSEGHMYLGAWFDASVGRLPTRLDRQSLQAILTIDGGERVDRDALAEPTGAAYVWPGFWVLLAAEIAFVAAAIARRLRLARRLRSQGVA